MPPDAYKGMAPDGKAQFMGKGGPDKGFGGKGDFDGKDGKGFGGKEPFMGKDMDGKGFGGKDPMVIFFLLDRAKSKVFGEIIQAPTWARQQFDQIFGRSTH